MPYYVVALSALDPEIEWHATVGGIDEVRVYQGREEVVQGVRRTALEGEAFRIEDDPQPESLSF